MIDEGQLAGVSLQLPELCSRMFNPAQAKAIKPLVLQVTGMGKGWERERTWKEGERRDKGWRKGQGNAGMWG